MFLAQLLLTVSVCLQVDKILTPCKLLMWAILRPTERYWLPAGFLNRRCWILKSKKINSFRWLSPTKTATPSNSQLLTWCRKCWTETNHRTSHLPSTTQQVEVSQQETCPWHSSIRTKRRRSEPRTSLSYRSITWGPMGTTSQANQSLGITQVTIVTRLGIRGQHPRGIHSLIINREWIALSTRQK